MGILRYVKKALDDRDSMRFYEPETGASGLTDEGERRAEEAYKELMGELEAFIKEIDPKMRDAGLQGKEGLEQDRVGGEWIDFVDRLLKEVGRSDPEGVASEVWDNDLLPRIHEAEAHWKNDYGIEVWTY